MTGFPPSLFSCRFREPPVAGGKTIDRIQSTRAQARRLIRSLSLPEELWKVLTQSRFWSPAFVECFLERCDEVLVDDVRSGAILAQAAPQLVSFIRAEPATLRKLQARALSVLATSYRYQRQFRSAEDTYQEALALLGHGEVLERAGILRRMLVFRAAEKRVDEALELAEQVIALYSAEGTESEVGTVLMLRGMVYYVSGDVDRSFADFGRSLALINRREAPHFYHAAIHNLAIVLGERASTLEELNFALNYLQKAKRLCRQPNGIAGLKLRWLEGLIHAKIGTGRQAERLFKKAREGFAARGAVYEYALASFELGLVYEQDGRWDELEKLSGETYLLMQQIPGASEEAMAALLRWVGAIEQRALGQAVIEEVRTILHAYSQKRK